MSASSTVKLIETCVKLIRVKCVHIAITEIITRAKITCYLHFFVTQTDSMLRNHEILLDEIANVIYF